MTIHVLVEGPSERVFFDHWIPRLRFDEKVRVHQHQGKGSLPRIFDARPEPKARGLLDQLPAKLRGFAADLDPKSDGVLVLVDADEDDVGELTKRIMTLAGHCAPGLRVRVSVAVEELEAFYLGDLGALKRAFPEADLNAAREYVPDSICGTWELFGKIVSDGGGNKVAWAEAMGPRVTTQPKRSRSPSFGGMLREIRGLVPVPAPPRKKRRYRHPAKAEKRGVGRR